jgi:hypothetical protein
MGFGGDRRGQSVQIGAVLLFGVLVLALTTYQATVVPQENGEVEFNHNQRVQNDMLQLRDGVLGAAAGGSARPVTVEMGTRYPVRAFLINPGPALGSLRTVNLGGTEKIAVRNARALDEEARDFWDGSTTREYDTRGLSYQPNYNEFDSAPTTAYGNTVVYNRAPAEAGGGVVPRSEQTLVDGRTLNLVALQGELDTAAVESRSVTPRGDSAPARTVAVQPDGGPMEIEIPTQLPRSAWEELLASEIDPGSGDTDPDRYVSGLSCSNSPPDPCGTLTITFETGATYNLRLAKVSVGSDSTSTTEAYITDVEGDETSIPEGGSQKLVVEVRDEYNNPVSGVTTSVTTAPSEGSVTAISATTDEDGEAVFRYKAPNNLNAAKDVDVGVGFDGPDGDTTAGSTAAEEAVFEVTVMDSDGSATGGGTASDVSLVTGSSSQPSKGVVAFDLENTGSGDATVNAIRIDSSTDPNADKVERTDNEFKRTDGAGSLDSVLQVGGSKQSLDTGVTIGAGTTGSFELGEIRKSTSNKPVQLNNDDVTITIFFSDGSSRQYKLSL